MTEQNELEGWYLISNVGIGLDGLLARFENVVNDSELVPITHLRKMEIVIGDRDLVIPVTPRSLYIARKNLSRVDRPRREYAFDNPYGKLTFEKTTTMPNGILIACALYEQAFTVTVISGGKTLVARNLKPHDWPAIERIIDRCGDADDLVFEIKDYKELRDGA